MLKIKNSILSAFFLMACSYAHAQGVPSKTLEEFDPSPYLRDIESKVKLKTLSNGLRVVYYRRGDAPVFSGVVAVRAGGVDEKLGNTGISHLLEHMAFKGSDVIGTKDYARERALLIEQELLMERKRSNLISTQELERIVAIEKELQGLWVGEAFTDEFQRRGAVGMNATTDKETTQYFESMPSGAFEFWAYMESERLFHPVMRQFYKELDVVLEEKRMRYEDSPRGKLYEGLLATAFTVHPYRQPVIGFEKDLKSLTASQLKEFHDKHYVPGNIVISVVGNIEERLFWRTMEKYFGKIDGAAAPARDIPVEPEQTEERKVEFSLPNAPEVYIAYKKPQWPDPEDVKVGMMLHTFSGGAKSPLYDELVRKRQVAVSAAFDEAPGSAYPNLAIFVAVPRAPHTPEEVLKAFDEVLTDFKSGKFDEQLLQNAKRQISLSMIGRLKSNMSLAQEFAESEVLHGNWNEVIAWYDAAMKVTKEDVTAAAQKYFIPTRRTLGIIRNSVTKQ